MNTLLLEHFDELISTPEDVERLNDAILQLAIRGKLVEQDATDEPACKLLEKIKEEKGKDFEFAKTYKKGDEPFNLPTGWGWIRFGDATINRDGERIPLSKEIRENRKGNYDYYGASGVIDKIDDFLFDKPLLLIGEDGANLVNRSTPIAFIADGKYWVNNHAHVLDAIDFSILKYLEVFINAIDLKPYITGTAQPKMNQAKMNSIVLAFPPLAEQKRIVARVEELFAQTRLLAEQLAHSRTELDRLNESALAHLLASETVEEFNERWSFIAEHFDLLTSAPEHIAPLRQSILELAVRGKLTRRDANDEPAKELLKRISDEKERLGITQSLIKVSEAEKTFDLPKGWEWVRWDDVSLQIADVDHKMPDKADEGIPYVSPRDFKGKEEISFSTAKKISRKDYDDLATKIRPERGDIIFPRYGTIGVNRFVSVDFEFLASYSCAIVKHMKVLMNPRFVYLYSISPFLKQETQKYINKTTQANVGIKSIQKFVFPLPPLAEQERIVKRVEQLLGWCDALEAQLQSAEEERGRLVESVLERII